MVAGNVLTGAAHNTFSCASRGRLLPPNNIVGFAQFVSHLFDNRICSTTLRSPATANSARIAAPTQAFAKWQPGALPANRRPPWMDWGAPQVDVPER